VTTASRGLSASRLAAEPAAGHVLALDVGVAGVAPDAFAGMSCDGLRSDKPEAAA
jgi:hypothetical protein